MKKISILLLIFAIFTAGYNTSHAQSEEEIAVIKATMEFYGAMDGMFQKKPALVAEIWSTGDDVTLMGPEGGYEIGWTNVYKEWMRQTLNKFPVSLDPTDLTVTVGPVLAVVNNYVEITREDKEASENTTPIKLRATTIFRKEQGKWKVIGHHVDSATYAKNK